MATRDACESAPNIDPHRCEVNQALRTPIGVRAPTPDDTLHFQEPAAPSHFNWLTSMSLASLDCHKSALRFSGRRQRTKALTTPSREQLLCPPLQRSRLRAARASGGGAYAASAVDSAPAP
jgi:hypothetical protein